MVNYIPSKGDIVTLDFDPQKGPSGEYIISIKQEEEIMSEKLVKL